MNAQSEVIEAEVVETTLPVPQQSRSVSVFDMPVAEFRGALDRRGDNRKALMSWVRQAMVEGVDFGAIHIVKKDKCKLGKWCKDENHFSKPVLFKPGSEKICGMLGVTPTFPTLPDYERMALEGKEIINVILRCHILSASKEIMADGIGARSLAHDYGDLNKALKMACKCLGGRTPVLLKHGDGAIRTDIHRMSQYDTDELYIAGPDASWRKVVDIRKQPAAPTRRITTRSGLTVSASLDHRWPLKDGKLLTTAELYIGAVLQVSQLPAGDRGADEEIAWAAGLFLAQGTIDEPHGVRFHLHAKHEDQARRLSALAERLGANSSDAVREGSNARTVSIFGTAICGVLRQFVIGELAYGKHFSRWLFRQKRTVMAAALQGYLEGDGYRVERDGRQPYWDLRFTGKNRELADDLRAICAILGYRCKIEPGSTTDQSGKRFGTYRGWIKETEPLYNAAELGEITELEEDHQITYEIEVDGDHLFCLANGIVTHNSAQIDATLRMAGLSEIFTQDLEDMQARDSAVETGATEAPPPSDFHDPRGDPEDRKDFDPKERNKYVSRFADALNADVEEDEKARLIAAIDTEFAGRQELYMAVFDVLTPSFRGAIKKYLEIHKRSKS